MSPTSRDLIRPQRGVPLLARVGVSCAHRVRAREPASYLPQDVATTPFILEIRSAVGRGRGSRSAIAGPGHDSPSSARLAVISVEWLTDGNQAGVLVSTVPSMRTNP